jgi:hypothetical protein
MTQIDIDGAIRSHNRWRRQFINAFAGGDYADMPLSEHRSARSPLHCSRASGRTSIGVRQLVAMHDRFSTALANEIVDLSNNGLGNSADLLLPELNESAHRLIARLDDARSLDQG